ncbi:hypothetical protein HY498_02620 [Candidatus Woesearchaeota archaeon]|nr:hypothetical protein [Candidatus Woesearchaeota archaeon]
MEFIGLENKPSGILGLGHNRLMSIFSLSLEEKKTLETYLSKKEKVGKGLFKEHATEKERKRFQDLQSTMNILDPVLASFLLCIGFSNVVKYGKSNSFGEEFIVFTEKVPMYKEDDLTLVLQPHFCFYPEGGTLNCYGYLQISTGNNTNESWRESYILTEILRRRYNGGTGLITHY